MIQSLLLAAAIAATDKGLPTGELEVISLDSNGGFANGSSVNPAVSATGQFVVFESQVRFLEPGDNNFNTDIYLFDRDRGMLERISQAPGGGATSGGQSFFPDVSADGRFVSFISNATNIVTPDTAADDLFVHDRQTGTTVALSRPAGGGFGDGDVTSARISGDGNWVVFVSLASNLVPDDGNGSADVFLVNRVTGELLRVSEGPNGEDATGETFQADISFDGRYVVFDSSANDLVTEDTNPANDLFLYDRIEDEVTLLTTTMGNPANGANFAPAVSEDGRFIAFLSNSTNLDPLDTDFQLDTLRLDRQTGTYVSVSRSPSQTGVVTLLPSISGDGSTVGFISPASDLVPGDANGFQDAFVWKDGNRAIVSVGPGGTSSDADSFSLALDRSGSVVAFASLAGNLVSGAGGSQIDVFARTGPGTSLVRSELAPPPNVDPGDGFGSAVATGSGTVAVGIPGDANLGDTTGAGSGRIALYTLEGGQSVPAGEISIPDGFTADGFGSSVSIANELMAVGAPMTDVLAKGTDAMQLAVYERVSGQWNVKQTLTGSGGGGDDEFGASIAMDGNLMVVGAPNDQAPGEDEPSGAVYLFEFDGANYVLQDKVKPAVAGANSLFGSSVDIDDGRIVVGAPGSSVGGAVAGAVELYEAIAGNMEPAGAMMPNGINPGDGFGASVSMEGDVVLAGAPGTDVGAEGDAGSAWTFQFGGGSAVQLLAPTPEADAGFGEAVAAANGELAAGAPGASGGGSVFRFGSELDLLQTLTAPAGQSGFGGALAASSLGVAVGAPESGASAGAASVLTNPDRVFGDGFERE